MTQVLGGERERDFSFNTFPRATRQSGWYGPFFTISFSSARVSYPWPGHNGRFLLCSQGSPLPFSFPFSHSRSLFAHGTSSNDRETRSCFVSVVAGGHKGSCVAQQTIAFLSRPIFLFRSKVDT